MDTAQWLDYFERNERRASPDTPATLTPLPPALQKPLVQALQCFQLGEAGGGSLTERARRSCPHVAEVVGVIAADEERHLAFQRDYFTRVLSVTHVLLRPFVALGLWIWFLGVLMGAITSVAFGQRKLFIALGVSPFTFAAMCLRRLWRLINQRDTGQPAATAPMKI
jgi:hypothetical protein